MAPSLRCLQRCIAITFLCLIIVGKIAIIDMPTQIRDSLHFNTGSGLDKSEVASLVRSAILADIGIIVLECIMIPLLFQLFKTYSVVWISISCLFRFIEVIVLASGGVFSYIAMLLLIHNGTAADQQLKTYLSVHDFCSKIWEPFFGLHCISLGYIMAFKCGSGFYNKIGGSSMSDSPINSNKFPKLLNYITATLIFAAGIGYILDGIYVALFLFDETESHPGKVWTDQTANQEKGEAAVYYNTLGGILSSVGELSFYLILIAVGVNQENFDLKRRRAAMADVRGQTEEDFESPMDDARLVER